MPWSEILLVLHADTLFRAFADDLDGKVFPNLATTEGCRRLMRAVRGVGCVPRDWACGGRGGGGWREGTAAAVERVASGRVALLSGGKVGIERWIGERFGELPAGANGDELRALAGSLAKPPTRLGSAERLAAGRGSAAGWWKVRSSNW